MANRDETFGARFESITEMQKEHGLLLQTVSDPLKDSEVAEVDSFLGRAVATGAVLDSPEDRRHAQGLIDYWVATLQSRVRSVQKTERLKSTNWLLAEFDSSTLSDIVSRADQWLSALSEQDQAIVRRVIMRLVRLDKDGIPRMHFGPSEMFDDLEPVSRTQEIVETLLRLGILRKANGPSGNDQVGLRTDTFLGIWKPLTDWVAERIRFRNEAMRWAAESVDQPTWTKRLLLVLKQQLVALGKQMERFGVAVWRLFGGRISDSTSLEFFEDSPFYRDKNQSERDYVFRTTVQARQESEAKRVLWSFLLLFLIFVLLGVVSFFAKEVAAAHAQQIKSEKEQATRRKRQRLKEMVGVVRLLAEYRRFAASDAQQSSRGNIALWRCENLVQSFQDDQDQWPDFKADLIRIGLTFDTRSVCVECSPHSAQIAVKLRELLEEHAGNDSDTRKYLDFLKAVNFRTLNEIVKKLAEAHGDNKSGRLTPIDRSYLDEFRIMEWGETIVVGNEKISNAMGEFADQLERVEKVAFESLDKEAELKLRDKAKDEKTLPYQPNLWQKAALYTSSKGDPLKLLPEQGTRKPVKVQTQVLSDRKNKLLMELPIPKESGSRPKN